MSTRDLIDAIESKNSSAIQREFHEAIMSRVAERLDAMRIEVAKNMFSESVELDEAAIRGVIKTTHGFKQPEGQDERDRAASMIKTNRRANREKGATDAYGNKVHDSDKVGKYSATHPKEPGGWLGGKPGTVAAVREDADMHKDRLEQILADHDINSHVEGDTVHVDRDDVKKAQKIVKNYGYDHQVQGGLNEVLSKKAKASEWISDFVHSKDPKFAGKSKEQRIKMGLAAYYAKQRDEAAECKGKTIEEEGCETRDDQPKFKLKLKRSTYK